MRNFPLLFCWEEQKGFQIRKTNKKKKSLKPLLAKVFRNKVPHMNAIICKGSKMCDLY